MGRKSKYDTESLLDLCIEYHKQFPHRKIKFSKLSEWAEEEKEFLGIKSYDFSRNPHAKNYIDDINVLVGSNGNDYEKIVFGQLDLFWEKPKAKQFEFLQQMTETLKDINVLKFSMENEKEKTNKKYESLKKEVDRLGLEIKKISKQINYLKNVVDEEMQLRIEVENGSVKDDSITNLENSIITAKGTLFSLSSVLAESILLFKESNPQIVQMQGNTIDFFSLKKQ